MRTYYLVLILFIIPIISSCKKDNEVSLRGERRAIIAGNKLYESGNFPEALKKYQESIEINPGSMVGKFNLGLTCISMGKGVQNNDSLSKSLISSGVGMLNDVAGIADRNKDLASKANYNLGNLSFENEDYSGAISLYKQALRLNPMFEDARRNLRIAQLKQSNYGGNDDQNQENNEDNQDSQDNQQNQDNKENQDNQQNNDNEEQQQPPKENELNSRTAEQILNAVENNENMTRTRMGHAQGNETVSGSASMKKW